MQIDGSKLSSKLRTYIGDATSGPEVSADFFVHRTESTGNKIVAAFFGAALVGLVVFGAVSRWAPFTRHYWGSPEIAVGLGTSFLAAWLAIAQLIRRRALGRSAIKPSIFASPILMGRSGLDDEPIQLHYLRDLVRPSFTHHHTNGSYTHTAVSLRFQDGTLSFDIRSRATAEKLMAFLKATPDKLTQWHTAGQLAQKVEELDWIQAFAIEAAKDAEEASGAQPRIKARPKFESDIQKLPPQVPAWERPLLTRRGQAVAALTVAAVVTTISYGANLLSVDEAHWSSARVVNTPEQYKSYLASAPLKLHADEARVRMDDRAFELAVAKKAASPLRAYRQEFPQGRHASEAKEEIAKLYRVAEEQYLAHTAKAEPQAAEGMKALFGYMREQDAPQVRICFLPGQGIDGKALESATRRGTGSNRVHGVSSSFSDEANRGREDRIVAIMAESFKKVLPQELFELKKAEPSEAGPRFLVRYEVKGTGSYYTTESEEDLPIAQRQVWIGIAIDFDFSLQVPGSKFPPHEDPENGYRFAMTARPAPNFDVRQGALPTEVYDRMVATAFDQFQVNLANSYGLELAMPASWGQLEGLTRRPKTPKLPRPEDIEIGRAKPTSPAMASVFAAKTPLDNLATEVVEEPGNEALGTTALYNELSKRARAKGMRPTAQDVKKAIDNAKIRKMLQGMNGRGK